MKQNKTNNQLHLEVLKDITGDEIFNTIVSVLGGSRISIPKCIYSVDKDKRNKSIIKEYERGVSVIDLAVKYDLNPSQIYKIIEKI